MTKVSWVMTSWNKKCCPPPGNQPNHAFSQKSKPLAIFFQFFSREANILLRYNTQSCQKSYENRILVLCLERHYKRLKNWRRHIFITQFCGSISDKKIFHSGFLYYICSYRLGNPICNITGNGGTKKTTLTWKYFTRGELLSWANSFQTLKNHISANFCDMDKLVAALSLSWWLSSNTGKKVWKLVNWNHEFDMTSSIVTSYFDIFCHL